MENIRIIEENEQLFQNMGIGVSKHYLDDSLTLIWGNKAFYHLLGYSKEEDAFPFTDLCQYYHNHFKAFEFIKKQIFDAYQKNQQSLECDVLIPTYDEKTIYVRMTITIQYYQGNKTVLYIMYTDINHLMLKIEERTNNFEWMMSEYTGNVYISDIDTYELLYVNQKACDTLQCVQSQILGSKCYETIQGRTSPCPFCTNDYLKANETYEWEFYNPNLQRTFLIKDKKVEWEGHNARIELSYDMYSAEYKLAKKDQEREAILKTIPAGMVRVDASDCITAIWYNGIFLDMIGYTKEQFHQELHNQCLYLHPDDSKRAQKLIKTLKKTGENVVFEAKAYTRLKEERIWTITLCYISGEDSWDGIDSFYSIGLDITDERRQIEKLKHKAEKDALTGVYNRQAMEEFVDDYFSQEDNDMCALFMIDVDNFKQINDSYGHMAGDVVLTEIAVAMKKLMRESDMVGRIGGDEFVIFMKDISSPVDAQKKAQSFLDVLHQLVNDQKGLHDVTCSIGISISPQDGDSFEKLYACADKALYQAKMLGKNKYMVYDAQMLSDNQEKFAYSLESTIDSEQKYAEGIDNLPRYIFRTLYQMENTSQAIQMILEIVGKQFDISRIYIFENHHIRNYEWCNDHISSQISQLQKVYEEKQSQYQALFQKDYIFYCEDIDALPLEFKELFIERNIHSTLQCAFKNNNIFDGFIGFDECSGKRIWTSDEVNTLTIVSQILAIFFENKKLVELSQQ